MPQLEGKVSNPIEQAPQHKFSDVALGGRENLLDDPAVVLDRAAYVTPMTGGAVVQSEPTAIREQDADQGPVATSPDRAGVQQTTPERVPEPTPDELKQGTLHVRLSVNGRTVEYVQGDLRDPEEALIHVEDAKTLPFRISTPGGEVSIFTSRPGEPVSRRAA